MKKLVVLSFVAALAVSYCAPLAMAQDKDNDSADLKAVLAELRQLRAEIKALRVEVTQLKAQLKKTDTKKPNKRTRPQDNKVYNIDIEGAPFMGPADAKVTIVGFFDLQCPYCSREAPVIKQVMKKYPEDVKFVFKNFPLSFHKQAKPVHALCMQAFKEGGNDKFWAMYEKIVANPKQLDPATLKGYAAELGLNVEAAAALLEDEAAQTELLKKDMTKARTYGVRGTPSVFINGKKLSPRGFDNYCKQIDEALSGKKAPAGKPAAKVETKGGVEIKRLPGAPANMKNKKD